MKLPNRNKTITEDEFWTRVGRRGDDECWLWTGGTRHGYGSMKYKGKYITAHRFAYTIAVGPIPAGLSILHSCDTPACCNPNHLRAGTAKDNAHDRDSRKRQWRDRGYHCSLGEKNTQAVIDEHMVRRIRIMASDGLTASAIASRTGVTYNIAYNVLHRVAWTHVV